MDSGHPFRERVLTTVFSAYGGGRNLTTRHLANSGGTRSETSIRMPELPLGVHPLYAPTLETAFFEGYH